MWFGTAQFVSILGESKKKENKEENNQKKI